MTQSLNEFFREKKKRADVEASSIDWNRRVTDWISEVKSLYGSIEQLLAEPIKQGSLTVSRMPKTITESYLGTYDTEDLILAVGDEKVVFSPKGRNIVGAKGRVDVRGESGEGTLVLRDSRWSVVISKYPQLRLVPLNSENLGDLLQAVMRQ